MSNDDYFEEKVQASVALAVQCLVKEWQSLNPHEPKLQEEIDAWGAEFVEYVRKHAPVEKSAFAVDSPYGSSHLEIKFNIPRRNT